MSDTTHAEPGYKSGCAIIMVHGTFAGRMRRRTTCKALKRFRRREPDAKPEVNWYDCPGPLENALRAQLVKGGSGTWPGDPLIVGFDWTGENLASARYRAAKRLARRVKVLRDRGWREVFIVAHSHGGTVALQAANRCTPPISGIVTMGTPFISATRRVRTAPEQRVTELANHLLRLISGLLILLLCIFLVVRPVLDWLFAFFYPGADSTLFSILLAPVLLTFALPPIERRVLRSRWLRRVKCWHHVWTRRLTARPTATPCFAVRASDDEAFAVLMAGSLLNLFQKLNSRHLSKGLIAFTNPVATFFGRWHVSYIFMGVAGLALLAGHVFNIGGGLEQNNRYFLIFGGIGLALRVIEGALLWIILAFAALIYVPARLLTCFAAVPFGWDMAVMGLWLDLQVEQGPADQLYEAVTLSKDVVRDDGQVMRHAVYTMPPAVSAIENWIVARRMR